MAERRSSYEFDDLLACGRGELLGPGNAQLPLPPMLMVDRISSISDTGGAHGNGQIVAELKVAGHERLDALWQLTGFFLGWLGLSGQGRASGVGEVKFTREVTPDVKQLQYVIDIKRVIARKLKLAEADGILKAD